MSPLPGWNSKATRVTCGANLPLAAPPTCHTAKPSIAVNPVPLPPGRGKARDETAADRIADHHENDGMVAVSVHHCFSGGLLLLVE